MSAQRPSLGYQYARPVPAYRPRRNRTKTGCLCCRSRRKKCDERRPRCSGCEARQLACSWPDDEQTVRLRRPGSAQTKRARDDDGSHSKICSPDPTVQSSAEVTPAPDLPHRVGECMVPFSSAAGVKTPSKEILQCPGACILLEHFISQTSHILVGRDAHQNPWLHSILPLAYSDSLVMHAVLAISGVHRMHHTSHTMTEQATYTHYGQAIKQLGNGVATWARGGSQQDTLNLFLATNLLIMYELVEGDSNGHLIYHLRACREFTRHIIEHGCLDGDPDLIGFLLENYAYAALLACLAEPVSGESCEPSSVDDDLRSLLQRVRTYPMYGSLIGDAYELYQLIPEIARYVWCPEQRRGMCQYHDCLEAYKAIETKLLLWPDGNAQACSEDAQRYFTAELGNGIMIRNSLLMLLRYSWIRQRHTFDQAMDEGIQPLIDDNMVLEELLAASPVMNVSLWPLMVTGSMMRKDEQRLAFAHRLRAHRTRVPVMSSTLRLLDWLWHDTEIQSHGPEALARVARKHESRVCFA